MHPCVSDQHGVADMLGVTHRTVVAWTKAGRIPGVQIGDRWRYWMPAVTAAMGGAVAHEPPEERQIVSVNDLADYLGLTPHGVRVMVREGKIPASKVGRLWMVPWGRVRNAIAAGRPLDQLVTQG